MVYGNDGSQRFGCGMGCGMVINFAYEYKGARGLVHVLLRTRIK